MVEVVGVVVGGEGVMSGRGEEVTSGDAIASGGGVTSEEEAVTSGSGEAKAMGGGW